MSCQIVRHHEPVTARRPHTKLYEQTDRERLGKAVARAREAAGFKFRPAFEKASGVGATSLYKLERGAPVGPTVYESAARALPHWTEDTPLLILEGSAPPPTVAADRSVANATESDRAKIKNPDPADFDNEQDYIDAVYLYLRLAMNMSEESAIRGFHNAAVRFTNNKNAHRSHMGTSGDVVG